MAGDWEAEDLTAVLTVFARSVEEIVPRSWQRLRAAYVARHPHDEVGSVENAQSNISRHYDLSNELFASFLDPSMAYSSALFTEPDPDEAVLAEAQTRKVDRLLDEAGVGEGTRLLEIGTGWGELALRAARRGAQVTTITLSTEQAELATTRIAEAGLSDQVEVLVRDYRLVEGQYDAVVSVEMIEAVGLDYLPEYFATIDRVLAPGGRVAIQAITMADHRMLATRDTYTWVHKYIFPGGLIPSLEALDRAMAGTGLRVSGDLAMSDSYAQTLRLWDERFARAWPTLDLGLDETFARMWHFYLCYSRAGFEADYLDVHQLTLTRPGEATPSPSAHALEEAPA
nr:cyclopropane-fatty-acyl-phospholipid synthase family protein [Marihabitans asiaticum]